MEIERKFLLDGSIDNIPHYDNCRMYDEYMIRQGYLFSGSECEIRYRSLFQWRAWDIVPHVRYLQTFKMPTEDAKSREEIEYEISHELYREMFGRCKETIFKKRYEVIYDAPGTVRTLKFYVDIFERAECESLVEIEFDTTEEAEKFDPSTIPFLGEEVTGNKKYKNSAIAKRYYDASRGAKKAI